MTDRFRQSVDRPCAVLRQLPEGFLDCPADRLMQLLPGPTLFDLPGKDPRPLFISTLLHGNEDSGLSAIQTVLKQQLSRGLSRSLLLFIGNVRAAAQRRRTLQDQLDYNRIWPGTKIIDHKLIDMARWIFDYAACRHPIASIDIHNNTGFNPPYGCVPKLEPHFIALARMFSSYIVHFERPFGTHTAAFSTLCPAVTVECGKAGKESATQMAVRLIQSCLDLKAFDDEIKAPDQIDLLRTYAIVKTPHDASISFDGQFADFVFRKDIDQLNFKEIQAGEVFGSVQNGLYKLEILPGDGFDSPPGEYFDYINGKILLNKAAIPAMLTCDQKAVKLDCLCYLMHRINLDGERICS